MDTRVADELRNELQLQARRADSEDRKLLEACQALVRYQPFQVLQAHLQKMVDARGQSLLEPLEDTAKLGLQEYEKGTMKGLLLAIGLPEITIQVMQQARANAAIQSGSFEEDNGDDE